MCYQIAKIIIDVPTMQTDKPFSYLIPEELKQLVSVGMRVHVPFGRGNRLMQGFIVGLSAASNLTELSDVAELKAIAEVLDFEPVLNSEQLALADDMRQTVFSYKISILKAMLPNLLNSSYDKVLTTADSEVAKTYVVTKREIHFSSLDTKEQAVMMKLHREGRINMRYVAQSKARIKTEKRVSLVDKLALMNLAITSRATKRLAMKGFLETQPEETIWTFSELLVTFSRDVVTFFVRSEEHTSELQSPKD